MCKFPLHSKMTNNIVFRIICPCYKGKMVFFYRKNKKAPKVCKTKLWGLNFIYLESKILALKSKIY